MNTRNQEQLNQLPKEMLIQLYLQMDSALDTIMEQNRGSTIYSVVADDLGEADSLGSGSKTDYLGTEQGSPGGVEAASYVNCHHALAASQSGWGLCLQYCLRILLQRKGTGDLPFTNKSQINTKCIFISIFVLLLPQEEEMMSVFLLSLELVRV